MGRVWQREWRREDPAAVHAASSGTPRSPTRHGHTAAGRAPASPALALHPPPPARRPNDTERAGGHQRGGQALTDSVTLESLVSAGRAPRVVGDAQRHYVERVVALGDRQLAGELPGLLRIQARLLEVSRGGVLAVGHRARGRLGFRPCCGRVERGPTLGSNPGSPLGSSRDLGQIILSEPLFAASGGSVSIKHWSLAPGGCTKDAGGPLSLWAHLGPLASPQKRHSRSSECQRGPQETGHVWQASPERSLGDYRYSRYVRHHPTWPGSLRLHPLTGAGMRGHAWQPHI